MPDFKGHVSDLGGPSANMYRMEGRDLDECRACLRPSCIHPRVCANLDPATRNCRIWETGAYPEVCRQFKPAPEVCGDSAEEAIRLIGALENATR